MGLSHFYQKVIVFSTWLVINTILIVTSIIYSNYWYIFLVPLSVSTTFNCISVFLIIAFKLKNILFKKSRNETIDSRSIAYLIPCYNESEDELKKTLVSLKNQKDLENHKKMMIIVCDGRVKGQGSDITTDQIVKNILLENTRGTKRFENAYTTWTGDKNNVELVYGNIDDIPFLAIIKDNNVGKRDGLVLVRSMLYNYNNHIWDVSLSSDFENFVKNYFEGSEIDKFDYVVGTDADTEFEVDCTSKLLKEIDSDPDTHGVVGFVLISDQVNKWSIWCIYQFTEYIIAQCLRRLQQSIVTNKVSCLSGCVQILRVSKETCGEEILKEFNKLPKMEDNVWKHILSFASEDRNHVCLMLHMYPYVKTKQCLDAISYTVIPTNLNVFKSQRRRWSLGATSNDILLTYKSGINLYERIGAIFNVLTYSLSLFIFVATILFYYSIFNHPSVIMLYLSTVIFIPILYEICIIFWFPFKNKLDILRFFIGLVFYLIFGSVINITIGIYSILNVDCFKWGKTRLVESQGQTLDKEESKEN